MKVGFLDPGGGGKKNSKHGKQPPGKNINTNGPFGLGFVSDFPLLVDDIGTVHVQDGGLNDVNIVTGGASNTGPILVTNVAKVKEGFAVNATPIADDDTIMPSTKLDTAESIPLTSTSAGTHSAALVNSGIPNVLKTGSIPNVLKDSSYANKLSLTLLNKANLRKLDANVPNDADFNI
ncbi:hypothetical protein Tco_0599782 [Tanacetum coccineum]